MVTVTIGYTGQGRSDALRIRLKLPDRVLDGVPASLEAIFVKQYCRRRGGGGGACFPPQGCGIELARGGVRLDGSKPLRAQVADGDELAALLKLAPMRTAWSGKASSETLSAAPTPAPPAPPPAATAAAPPPASPKAAAAPGPSKGVVKRGFLDRPKSAAKRESPRQAAQLLRKKRQMAAAKMGEAEELLEALTQGRVDDAVAAAEKSCASLASAAASGGAATGGHDEGEADSLSRREIELVLRQDKTVREARRILEDDVAPFFPSDAEVEFLLSCACFYSRDIPSALEHSNAALGLDPSLADRWHYTGVLHMRRRADLEIVGERTKAGVPAEDGFDATERAARIAEHTEQARECLETALEIDPRRPATYVELSSLDRDEASLPRSRAYAARAIEHGMFWTSGYQRVPAFLRGLRSKPFWEREEFEWTSVLEDGYKDIQAELAGLLNSKRAPNKERWDRVGAQHDEHDQSIATGGDWREVVLLHGDSEFSAFFQRNRERCPKTVALLKRLSTVTKCGSMGVGEVTFSSMAPGTRLKPHCGGSNLRLTAHLGLHIPDGCSIRVGAETRTWEEGKVLFFDDSWEHEVSHAGPSGHRVILLIRFFHPDIAPEKYEWATRAGRMTYLGFHKAATNPPCGVDYGYVAGDIAEAPG